MDYCGTSLLLCEIIPAFVRDSMFGGVNLNRAEKIGAVGVEQDVHPQFLMQQHDQLREYKLPFRVQMDFRLIENDGSALFKGSVLKKPLKEHKSFQTRGEAWDFKCMIRFRVKIGVPAAILFYKASTANTGQFAVDIIQLMADHQLVRYVVLLLLEV